VLKHARDLDKPVAHFRSLAYYEHDANAKRFRPPPDLANVFHKWTIYETCEFLHYALEVAFDAILQHLPDADIADTFASRFIDNTVRAALSVTSATLGLATRKADWCNRTLGDILDEARTRQKPLEDWYNDPWSETNLISGLEGQPPLIRLARAFACLLAIYARNRLPQNPFEAFPTLTTDWLARFEVTLATVRDFLSDRVDKNATTVLAELLKECVVGQHLHVAMRKLRNESQSTFKLAIEDGRFIWLENFEPTRTNPRLRQAFHFLRDLGLCSGESEGWKISSMGKEQLRQADGN
jgi:hypothetical protein